MKSKKVSVPARHLGGWFDTGVTVLPGTEVKLVYVSGKWTGNQDMGWFGPEGDANHTAKSGYLVEGENESALVCRTVLRTTTESWR